MNKKLSGKTILLVEDEADLRAPIAEELVYLGARVLEAANGQEALLLLRSNPVNAIVSDVRMPGGDGVELLRNVKASNHEFPVMMLITGFSDLSREDAYHLGAEAILSKPFDLDALITAVERILKTPEEKWGGPQGAVATSKVSQSHAGLDAAIAGNSIGVGRGGLFLRMPSPPPVPNSQVDFLIRFESGDVPELSGSGVVRWVRHEAAVGLPSGFGLEFDSLSEESRGRVLKIVEAHKIAPFIPREPHPKLP